MGYSSKLLKKKPDELYNIDTVDKAGRWHIDLVGAARMGFPDKTAVALGCHNIYSWKSESSSEWRKKDVCESCVETKKKKDSSRQHFGRLARRLRSGSE
jgi:hypothetical protein